MKDRGKIEQTGSEGMGGGGFADLSKGPTGHPGVSLYKEGQSGGH